MPSKWFEDAVKQFRQLGTRAIEFTGGGDPTLWPHINRAMQYLTYLDFHIGIITNGLGFDKIEDWNLFDWVRISLNTLDYRDDLDLRPYLESDVPLSFCYIWNKNSVSKISKIIEFANRHKIICRIAPDCIVPLYKIEKQTIPSEQY